MRYERISATIFTPFYVPKNGDEATPCGLLKQWHIFFKYLCRCPTIDGCIFRHTEALAYSPDGFFIFGAPANNEFYLLRHVAPIIGTKLNISRHLSQMRSPYRSTIWFSPVIGSLGVRLEVTCVSWYLPKPLS